MSEYRSIIKKVIKAEPRLCRNGLGVTENGRVVFSGEKFKDSQHTLFRDESLFILCRRWLSAQRKVKSPTTSSYYLKHVVENWAQVYIPQGVFIAAAIDLGWKYKDRRDCHAVTLYISKDLQYHDGVPVA